MRKIRIYLGILAAIFVGSTAHAGLTFCNETEHRQSISIGSKKDGAWTSDGWWVLEKGECKSPIEADLKQRYYYYRAEVDAGPFDGENYYFCTTSDAYTIVGDEDCEARGYDRESFREIDTGTTSTSFTFLINDDTGGTVGSGLTFCNETDHTQSISVGYKDGEGWTSEGWWVMEKGECKSPIKGDLTHRYYYYRAEVDAGPFEGEDYWFCTDPSAYTIKGDTDCDSRGYDREEFREIDTGLSSKSFTFLLTAKTGAAPIAKSTKTGLEVCNETEHTQAISIGYEGDTDWTSEGWWNLEPGECSTPIKELKRRYYYYRAEINGGPFEGEGYYFCTTPSSYTIVGDKGCKEQGYDREAFSEIDVGDYTYFHFRIIPH